MTATDTAIELVRAAAVAAADKIGTDVVAYDMSDHLAITDAFLIVTAASERQVGAVVDGIEEELLKRGIRPLRREGDRENRWVLLDYYEMVVHVMHTEEREYYSLERLWRDCPQIELPADLEKR
ncbi:MAG: ribosome silencing factor [Propionibacteriaceae bacterium]